ARARRLATGRSRRAPRARAYFSLLALRATSDLRRFAVLAWIAPPLAALSMRWKATFMAAVTAALSPLATASSMRLSAVRMPEVRARLAVLRRMPWRLRLAADFVCGIAIRIPG